MPANSKSDLRSFLRETTRDAHDSLDATMSAKGWQTPKAYARFLQVQYAARLPIESWAKKRVCGDLRLPLQTHFIETDLGDLDVSPCLPLHRFALPVDASPLGALWAIAGSSLGNRVIAKSLKNGCDGALMPMRFLSDPSMGAFWKTLLPILSAPVKRGEADAARKGALAVFDHFARVATLPPARKIAA